MCTAVSFLSGSHYFGRNLDLDFCYNEAVTITPRNYAFHFRNKETLPHHFAIIGIATTANGYPLYYDATNEVGLSAAGLNFPSNAFYGGIRKDQYNVAPFELIPWILTQCQTVSDAELLLAKTNLAGISFSPAYPLTDLHWIVADKNKSITVEPLKDGLIITENPVGVLTNNPPFDYHLHNLKNYLMLSEKEPENRFAPDLPLKPYSRGMGAMGLPGDLSSASRFVRAAFTKLHSVKPQEESMAVSQFFHILGSVVQQEGCVKVGDQFEKTVYTSCCNTGSGIYYYTTYENSQITAVHMNKADLDGNLLTSYPLLRTQQIRNEN